MIDSVAAAFSPPVTAKPPAAEAEAPRIASSERVEAPKDPHRGHNVDITA